MLSTFAAIFLGVFATFLFVLAVLVVVRPTVMERFFLGFASTAKIHFTEQSVRLAIGIALVLRAPEMAMSVVFQWIGWTIVGTTVALVLLPWRWHHAFAQVVLPMVVRFMKFYALGLFLFGVFLLYGLIGASA